MLPAKPVSFSGTTRDVYLPLIKPYRGKGADAVSLSEYMRLQSQLKADQPQRAPLASSNKQEQTVHSGGRVMASSSNASGGGRTGYQGKSFEQKFNNIIHSLGTFKIKSAQSNLLLPYFKMKLQCETKRFVYETIVIGDECDDEIKARENLFRKAFNILIYHYKWDLEEMEKRASPSYP